MKTIKYICILLVFLSLAIFCLFYVVSYNYSEIIFYDYDFSNPEEIYTNFSELGFKFKQIYDEFPERNILFNKTEIHYWYNLNDKYVILFISNNGEKIIKKILSKKTIKNIKKISIPDNLVDEEIIECEIWEIGNKKYFFRRNDENIKLYIKLL